MSKQDIISRIVGNAGKPDQFKPTTMAVAFVLAVIHEEKNK